MDQSSSSLFPTPSMRKRKRDPDSFNDEPRLSKMPKNDVFVNYSYEDVGKRFISHLKGALNDSSFTISDHTMLPVGEDVDLQLLKAIEESEIYVLVFSLNYASSTRSLDELLDIMGSFRKFKERKVVPVFFEVDPSHVRHQQGPFREAFQAHNTNIHPDRVQEWRDALKDASQLSGLTFQNGDESKFIRKIVKELEKMQRPQALHVTDHPVGIGSRAEELISTLRLDLKDPVLVVAVFGIGGIGKTTIVKEAFNRIAPSFDHCVFLADIHYMCQVPNWKVELPKALVSCLTRENKFSIMTNHNEGVTKIRRLVSRQKILLVLDDIDNFQQLESLGICPEWFYEGSRIIVTTRDKGSLGNIPYASYHIKLLNRRESLNLFTRLMFAKDDPLNTKFIEEVVGHAGGLPLVLKVWSRHFKQYKREQWPSILETLKGIPHGDVQKQLQLSYDSLTNRAKKLFLDIVCFFDDGGHVDMDMVVKVLQDKNSGFFPTNEIHYLVDKSLLEIRSESRSKKLWMHRLIREMGYEIVRQENEEEPGQRTRLWKQKDVMRVLRECSGTQSVESIAMSGYYMEEEATVEALRMMSNLRLIHFQGGIFPHDDKTHLCFKKLKYMFWDEFPFKSFDNIDMGNIVVLRVRNNILEVLWEGIKSLKKLRILDVSNSLSLTKTGNFSGLENLEELYLFKCKNLKELHFSIGNLQKLAIMDLRSSIPLKRIPWEIIGKLASLRKLFLGDPEELVYHQELIIGDCPEELEEYHPKLTLSDADYMLPSLKECPLTELELWKCNTSHIPGGVGSLALLRNLTLCQTDLSAHPADSLLQLHRLNSFELVHCDNIQSIPNLPGNITSVRAERCTSLVNLPCNISKLKSLTILHFESCHKLGNDFLMKVTGVMSLTHLTVEDCSISQVPSEIGNLVSLKELVLTCNSFSSLPDSLSNLSQLVFLNIRCCEQLRWLPLLPSNQTYVDAWGCLSLDVQSPASIRFKAPPRKELPCRNRFMIRLPCEVIPNWCSYQNTGDILSFVAPMHLGNNICGIILCASAPRRLRSSFILTKMYNKTKKISHCFEMEVESDVSLVITNVDRGICIVYYPLDGTTLSVEPGDSVALELRSRQFARSCGLRLIYESDVVDGKLVIPTPTTEHIPHVPLEVPVGITPLTTISIDSHNDDYSSYDDYSDYDDHYSDYDDEDEDE